MVHFDFETTVSHDKPNYQFWALGLSGNRLMRGFLFVLAISFSIGSAASCARDLPPSRPDLVALNSQLFIFSGWCTGRDMVFRWSIDGKQAGSGERPSNGEAGAAFIYPWLDYDIAIRGVEVTVSSSSGWRSVLFGPANFRWLMVGNNASGDIMLSIPKGSLYGMNWFPAGTGFFFPGKRSKSPLTYIDLHGACSLLGRANVFVNLYYTKAPPTIEP
jgi:hypothetical protein